MYFTYYYFILLYLTSFYNSKELEFDFENQYVNLTSLELINFNVENSIYQFIFQDKNPQENETHNSQVVKYSFLKNKILSKSNLFLSKYGKIIKLIQSNNNYCFLYKTYNNLIDLFYENKIYKTSINFTEIDLNCIYLTFLNSKVIFLSPDKEKKKILLFYVNDGVHNMETKMIEYINIKYINFNDYILCMTYKNNKNYFSKIYFDDNKLQIHILLSFEYKIFDLYNNNNEYFILCFSNDNKTIKYFSYTDFDNFKNNNSKISNNITFEETIISFKIIKDNKNLKIIVDTDEGYIIQNLDPLDNSIEINDNKKSFRYQSNNTIERIELINKQLYIFTKSESDTKIIINEFSDYSMQTIKLYLNDFENPGIRFDFLNSFISSSDEIIFENNIAIQKNNEFYFTLKQIGKKQIYYYTNESKYYYILDFFIYCNETTYYKIDTNECLSEAPEEYFIDIIDNKIIKCSDNCKKCSMIGIGKSKCIKCKNYYKLYNYNCIESCPDKSFIYNDNCYDECPINTSIVDENKCFDNIRNDYTETILNFSNSNQTIQEYIINNTYNNIYDGYQNNKSNLTFFSNFVILYNLYIENYNWEKNYSSDLEIIFKNYTSNIISNSNYSNLDYLDIIETYVNFFRNIKQLSNESQYILISNLSEKINSLHKLNISKKEIPLFLNLLSEYIKNLKNLNSLNYENKYINNNISYFLNISSIVNIYSKGVMESVNDYRKFLIKYLNNTSLNNNSFNSSQISFATFFINNSEYDFTNSDLNISITHLNFDKLSSGEKLKTLKSLNSKMTLIVPFNFLNISYISITKFLSFPYLNKKLIKYILNQFFSINFYNLEIKEVNINNSLQNISIAFKRENPNFKYCIFYNNTSNKLSSNGCISRLIGDYIICSCNHLTDFSISSINLNTEYDYLNKDINENNFWKSRIISSPLNLKSFTLKNATMIYIFAIILFFFFSLLIYSIYWDISNYNEEKGDLFIRYIEDNNIKTQILKIKILVDEEIKFYLNSENSQDINKSLSDNLVKENENENDDSFNKYLKKEDINKDNNNRNEILIEMKEISSINNNNNKDSNKMKIKNLSSLNEMNKSKNKYIKDKEDIPIKRLSINFLQIRYRLNSFKLKYKKTFDFHIKNESNVLSQLDNKEEILLNSSKNKKWLSFIILFFITFKFEYRFCILFSDYPIIISKTCLLTLIVFRFFLQIGIITIFSIRYEMHESINLLKEIQIVFFSVILSDIIYNIFKFFLIKKKITINMRKTDELVIKYKSVCCTILSFFIIFGISCFIFINNLWISIYEIENNIKIHYLSEFIVNIVFDYFIYEIIIISIKAFFFDLLLSKYSKDGIFYKLMMCIAKKIHNILIFYIVE